MRISDWSSDVCSSDLALRHIRQASPQAPRPEASETASALLPLLFRLGDACAHLNGRCAAMALAARDRRLDRNHVIDPPDRKSVVSGKSVSVRVDLRGSNIM